MVNIILKRLEARQDEERLGNLLDIKQPKREKNKQQVEGKKESEREETDRFAEETDRTGM